MGSSTLVDALTESTPPPVDNLDRGATEKDRADMDYIVSELMV